MKRLIIKLISKLFFRDEIRSKGIRKLYKLAYNIDVGDYSYGCFDPIRIPSGTVIGRYCSISRTAYIFNANHPIKFCSLHPFFYNASTKFGVQTNFTRTKLVIEDDVWLGHNSSILAGVTHLGRGCIVGSGAVVTKNVPAYSIVGGVPAKIIGYRFDTGTIDKIEASAWWKLDEEELKKDFEQNPHKYIEPESYFNDY